MTIPQILTTSKTIAIVGLSPLPSRPSHNVAQYLLSRHFQILPVNPNESQILNLKSFPTLEDIPAPIDIVNIFRRSEHVPALVQSAIKLNARCVWMQEGVIHQPAAALARDAGLFVVMDRCILKEHQHLLLW